MTSDTHTTQHVLKCWPVYFDAILRGDKNFELRLDDRGFQKGDTILLQRTCERDLHRVEYDLHGKPKHEIRKRVSYILTGGQFGLEPGYVVMALEDIDRD